MEENYFISAEIQTDGWIGFREVPGNKMNWTDDITEPVYVNWPAGEPFYEDGQNDCAYFSLSSGTWHAKNCEDVLHFVCEKSKLDGIIFSHSVCDSVDPVKTRVSKLQK